MKRQCLPKITLVACGLAIAWWCSCIASAHAKVSCGGHSASKCGECGSDWTWCNGECAWDHDTNACVQHSERRRPDNAKRAGGKPRQQPTSNFPGYYDCNADHSCGPGKNVHQASWRTFGAKALGSRKDLLSSLEDVEDPQTCSDAADDTGETESSPQPREAVAYPADVQSGAAHVVLHEASKTLELWNDVLNVTFDARSGFSVTTLIEKRIQRHTSDAAVGFDSDGGAPTAVPTATTVVNGDFAFTNAVSGHVCRGRDFYSEWLSEDGHEPQVERILPDPRATRAGDRAGGWRVRAVMHGAGASQLADESDQRSTCSAGYEAHWTAELRDGSNYLKVMLSLEQISDAAKSVAELFLMHASVEHQQRGDDCSALPTWATKSIGRVTSGLGARTALDGGVAALSSTSFVALEHPLSKNGIFFDGMPARCATTWGVICGRHVLHNASASPARAAISSTVPQETMVIGVAPDKLQVRRAFLYYLERERAHPSRMNVHYNTWYDLAAGSLFSEQDLLKTIATFNRELRQKRGVDLDSFLADDGWDNRTHGVWEPHRCVEASFVCACCAIAGIRSSLALLQWLAQWFQCSCQGS